MIGFARRYLFLKSVRPVLQKYLGNRFLMILADFVYRFTYLAFVKIMIIMVNMRNNYSITEIPINDVSDKRNVIFDGFCFFNPNLEKNKWKIENSIHKQSIYEIYDCGKAVGYFILRTKSIKFNNSSMYSRCKIMTLMDFGFYVNDTNTLYKNTIVKAVLEFLDSDSDVLEIITSSKEIIKCCKIFLFIRVGRGMSFIFNGFDLPGVNFKKDLDCWHLTNFCGDAFTYK